MQIPNTSIVYISVMLQHLQISTTWAGSLGTASWPCPTFSAWLSALSCSSHSLAQQPLLLPLLLLRLCLSHSLVTLLVPCFPFSTCVLSAVSCWCCRVKIEDWMADYLIICVLLVILRRRHMLMLEWKAWLNPRLLLGHKHHENKFKGIAFFSPPLNLFICSTLTTDKSICFPWA